MKDRYWQFFSLFPLMLLVMLLATFLTGCATHRVTLTVSAPAPVTAAPPAGSYQVAMSQQSTMTGGASSQPSSEATSSEGATGEGATPSDEDAASGKRVASADSTKASLEGFRPNEALRNIHFDFDKQEIRPGDAEILGENARWMEANPEYLVLIEGHCDDRGTNEYNLALGERRAKATMTYLVSEGIEANRIMVVSYGKERPLCTKRNEACWSKNRRADFLVKAP